jgi:hypothetical protein
MLPTWHEPAQPLDPAHFAAVRRPLLEAETLPTWAYTSPSFYRREIERIFGKVWNFVGHVDQLPEPGSYVAFDFVGVPVILARGKDGTGARLRQLLPPPRRQAAGGLRHRGRDPLPLPQLDLRPGGPAARRGADGGHGRLRQGELRPGRVPRRPLGRLPLPLPRPRRAAAGGLPGRAAGAAGALQSRGHGAGAPEDLGRRLQLEDLRRERDGVLSRADGALEDHPAAEARHQPAAARQDRPVVRPLHPPQRQPRAGGRRHRLPLHPLAEPARAPRAPTTSCSTPPRCWR